MSSERPPFILVFAGDLQGCGFHRCAVPLMSMVMPGHAEGRMDLAFWPLEMIEAVKPDTIVFQRYLEDGQVEAMRKIREKLPDTLLVYELDDYLGEVPPASYHAGFMPPDLSKKIAAAAAVCHRVTTSTEPLAEWFRDELGHPDVRVVPNCIPGAAVRKRNARPDGQRLRVGFAGGISHAGDLELIRPAMKEIGDAVEWVFFGMQLKDPPVRVEFHGGVQPSEYQMRMLELDLDLVLAPLEDNRFNRCKSNLRILEAGMIGACVIAQRLDPYVDGNPPVYMHAETPEEWTTAIRYFAGDSTDERQKNSDALREWVLESHTIEKALPRRIGAWLSSSESAWTPGQVKARSENIVVSLLDGAGEQGFARNAMRRSTLVDACRLASSNGADVLWLRPGTLLDDVGFASMRKALVQGDNIASVVPIASDGPNSFPRTDRWTPMTPDVALAVAASLRAAGPDRRMIIAAPSGPAALLSARTLAAIGSPDPAGCDGNEEQAIMEWGLRAAMRGWRALQAADAYAASSVPPMQPTQRSAQRLSLRGYGQALSSMPTESMSPQERASIELDMLREQWGGPMPGTAGFGHDYMSWSALKGDLSPIMFSADELAELCVVRFGSDTPLPAACTWVVFVDDTIEWRTNGLAHLRKAVLNALSETIVIYGDNEFRDPNGNTYPDFKPNFDLELLLARDYVTPVCAVQRNALPQNLPLDRAELYGCILDIAENAGSHVFRHVTEMLAAVKDEGSPEVAAMVAIGRQIAIEKVYGDSVSVSANPMIPGALSVQRHWDVAWNGSKVARTYGNEHRPLVSIIIPTLGAGHLIQPCVNTIRQHTRYPNYEIIVVQNGGEREEPELGAAKDDPRVRVVHWSSPDGKFNWSALNNDAAWNHTEGRFLCFMNDDVRVGGEGWLDAMMGHAIREDVGAVGARLLHPAGFIQHVGVVCHNGVAGHSFKALANGHSGNGWLAMLTHEASAVTGACMLVSRDHFKDVGGFDEEAFPLNYGDTDFCLKLRDMGLRNVVEMKAELLHPEGTSRTDPNDVAGLLRRLQRDNTEFAKRWPGPDPYWHPSLAISVSQGGMSMHGLNRDLLLWENRKVAEGAVRVLLVNDTPGIAGQAAARMRSGEILYVADLSGFSLRLTAPMPANIAGWDVRNPEAMASDLKRLGIRRVVLRSLVGQQGPAAPVESLRCLAHLGIPVDVDPIDPAMMTPWLSEAKTMGVFGFSTDVSAWRAAYAELAPDVMEAAE